MTSYAITTAPTAGTNGTTGRLLAGAPAAVALFTVGALSQAALRPGYDLTRHPVSVLANGGLGWIQTSIFLATGVLMLGCSVGLRRVRAGVAAPVLLAVQGAGLIIAGVFRMDPLDGFPIGTAPGTPASMSAQAVLHNVGGSVSFLVLIAACFVLAGRFAADGRRGWAHAGRLSGTLFALGLGWAIGGGSAGSLTLFVGCVVAWSWVAAGAVRLGRRPGPARS